MDLIINIFIRSIISYLFSSILSWSLDFTEWNFFSYISFVVILFYLIFGKDETFNSH